jgi:tRNA nucleotidyltransferase (CCA-adding enzyme)
MIKYPQSIDTIFNKLYKHNIKPVIVGGYIRDTLLNIPSNDIDIELYGVASFDEVQNLLKEFARVNNVGKSFGICKLVYDNLELDFSLPRKDSKIASGHQGFEITVDSNLDFKTAASRRDFTINAIGYDVKNKQILDPYHGRADLEKKLLKAVDNEKFKEDPLRVLRAVVFASRFHMTLDTALEFTCKDMIKQKLLEELPKERIFQEIKKLFLKSNKPSIGFNLLKNLGAFSFFKELDTLNDKAYKELLNAIDNLKYLQITNEKEFVILALAVLTSKFSNTLTKTFLERITNEKKIIEKVFLLHEIDFNLENFNECDIYTLATKIDIEFYSHYLHVTENNKNKIEYLVQKANMLSVLHHPIPALIQGKDLIELGLQPSKEFSKILEYAYIQQIKNNFENKKDAILWLKKYLFS